MSTETAKIARIFEYLLAVKNLNEKIIRIVNDYEQVWWEKDIPQIDGFYIGGSGTSEEAWFEVHKQEIPTVPQVPSELKKWVTKFDNPEQSPTVLEVLVIGIDEEEKEIMELFDEDPKRKTSYQQWIEEWEMWAAEASPKMKIQQLYTDLFTLYQRFEREGEDIELVCGHGLLQWKIDDKQISRHILVTKLEITFDAKKGIFHLLPTSKGTAMETDMLLHIDFPNATRVMKMENQIQELDFSPNQLDPIKSFLQEVVHTISPEGLFKTDKKDSLKSVSTPIISNSPAIFLRKTGGRFWQQELTNAIEKIQAGFPVPESIKKLITTSESGDDPKVLSPDWEAVGQELLFPLPANKEQQLIAEKLAANSGVVIQGPPGTGKSHTIANLISHLLAHGKRVLVTSEKERALHVLKNKIPKEIRPLCVSVLGGDSKSVKEIEDSVRVIAENIDSKQPEILQKNIERLKRELQTTKRSIERINQMINDAAERECIPKKFGDMELKPLDAAKWLKKFESHAWIPDNIKSDSPFPFSTEKLIKFFEILGLLAKEDIQSLSLVRPSLKSLPPSNVFLEKVNEIQGIEEKIEQTTEQIKGWTTEDFMSLDFAKWTTKTTEAIVKLKQMHNPKWLYTIIKDCVRESSQVPMWNQFIKEIDEKVIEIQILEKEIIEHKIVLTTNKILPELRDDLLVLNEKLSSNPKIGWLYKNVTGRKLKYLFEEIKVNTYPIRNSEDLTLVIKHIDLMIMKQKLSIKWNRVLDEIDGTKMEETQKRFALIIKEKCNQILNASNWVNNLEKEFEELFAVISMTGEHRFHEEQWLYELHQGLQAFHYKKTWHETQTFFQKIEVDLIAGMNQRHSHPLWNNLLDSLRKRNTTTWDAILSEVERLEGLEVDYQQLLELKSLLFDAAPKWTLELLETGGVGKPLIPPTDLEIAWIWRQVDAWLKELNAKQQIDHLEEHRKMAKLKEQKVIKELIAEATWKEQLERTTRTQKMSLFAWQKAIQRIGKGTGKYTRIYRQEASKEMKVARGAIPVWIMPIQRVIENFDLTEDMFDVVIIDESSQSNLFGLSAFLRGKKAVIVGDENQISPENAFTEISDVHELITRYLFDIPNKMQFDIRTSLYDTASRVFDSKIVLKEHFRCVPEIIKFSNELMYGGMIDPLRLPFAKDMFTPPVKAVKVDDGYRLDNTTKVINIPEAEAIVDYIIECIKDPIYYQKSFGVITLLGNDQQKVIEGLIHKKIVEEDIINRRLVVGDAYAFQGDERDVIFLSLVIAENKSFTSLGKKDALQRFNVAASRSRDQMILFHSVDANKLNPNDVRYRLLQHCLNHGETEEELVKEEHEFVSELERDIYTLISSKGYRVVPQVKVGTLGKAIDLVVEGERTRLAIECEGDMEWQGEEKWKEEIERQRVLERVGWTFWRIRGSVFYSNPEKTMESLFAKLSYMGIRPHNQQKETSNNVSPRVLKKEIILKKLNKQPVREKSKENFSTFKQDRNIKVEPQKNKTHSEQIALFSHELEGYHEQMDLIDLIDEAPESLYNYLTVKNYEVIDKRHKGGNLWLVGGAELRPLISELRQMGINFQFSIKGSRATKYRPGWFTSYMG
ncbi:AAA domain-containing protein [Neobacillus sp. BF23-41]|uniref:AAA domain-containing protein n=1 Tax=Neobacillus sp. BF23-41 TaxID=3240280 RepID=UPI0034E50540